jgi:streptogrisin C
MRRLIAILTVLFACLLGLPTAASAAVAPIGGGSILYNPFGSAGAQCIVAFAARGDYLIAGDTCGTGPGDSLYSGANVLVGPVVGEIDGLFVLVKVTNTAAWDVVGSISLGGVKYPVRGSAETPVGGHVCQLSYTAGVQCGAVTARNVTINLPAGTLYGLTQTNICPQPRSIVYITGDQVQGVPFNYPAGPCRSFFYPANSILSAYGLTLLTG